MTNITRILVPKTFYTHLYYKKNKVRTGSILLSNIKKKGPSFTPPSPVSLTNL